MASGVAACEELILRNSFVRMKNRPNFVRNQGLISHNQADVAKLVDASDLGSGAARLGGSSPFIRTKTQLTLQQKIGIV
jgi:hypothetical protein